MERRPEIGRVDCRTIRKMCVEATTHQKPSFKRVILFGARGSERVISRHRYRRRVTPTQKCARERIPPYLLNNQHQNPNPSGPAGLLPTDASSRHFFHVHTMCPLCTTAICISLGARENLIVTGGTRLAVASTSTRETPALSLPPPL